MATQVVDVQTTVTCTPGVMGGMPCIAGTRVPAETVRCYLVKGIAEAELFDDYPYLPAGTFAAVTAWSQSQGLACTPS